MAGLGEDVFHSGALIGSGAISALALQSPLGPIGGMIVGGCMFITEKPIEWLSSKMFNTDKATASKISKITSYVLSLFATSAINYTVIKALGYSLTFSNVFVLTGLTLLGAAALIALIGLIKWIVEKIFSKKKAEIQRSESLESINEKV